jgi:FkbM family methyltransferase
MGGRLRYVDAGAVERGLFIMKRLSNPKVYVESVVVTRDFAFPLRNMLIVVQRSLHLAIPILSPYEPHLEKYMTCPRGKAFVDVGASFGRWTEFMAKKGTKVYAFEPSFEPFRKLENLGSKYPNIVLFQYALGETDYKAELKLHRLSGHSSLTIESNDYTGNHISVAVRSLDSFNIQDAGLIKIDTEGYEVPVLLGAKNTIRKSKPRLIVEIHEPYPEQRVKIKRLLKSFGYHCIPLVTHIVGDP